MFKIVRQIYNYLFPPDRGNEAVSNELENTSSGSIKTEIRTVSKKRLNKKKYLSHKLTSMALGAQINNTCLLNHKRGREMKKSYKQVIVKPSCKALARKNIKITHPKEVKEELQLKFKKNLCSKEHKFQCLMESSSKKKVFVNNSFKIIKLELSDKSHKSKCQINKVISYVPQNKSCNIAVSKENVTNMTIKLNFEFKLEENVFQVVQRSSSHGQKCFELCSVTRFKLNSNQMKALQRFAQIMTMFVSQLQPSNILQERNVSERITRRKLSKGCLILTSKSRDVPWKISSIKLYDMGYVECPINKRMHSVLDIASHKYSCSEMKTEEKQLSHVAAMYIQLSRIPWNDVCVLNKHPCKVKTKVKKLSPMAEMYIQLCQY